MFARRDDKRSCVHRPFQISPPASESNQKWNMLISIELKKIINIEVASIIKLYLHQKRVREHCVDIALCLRHCTEFAQGAFLSRVHRGSFSKVRCMSHSVVEMLGYVSYLPSRKSANLLRAICGFYPSMLCLSDHFGHSPKFSLVKSKIYSQNL